MDHVKVIMHNRDDLKVFNNNMDHMKVFVHNKDYLKVSLNGWMKSLFIRLLLAISENNGMVAISENNSKSLLLAISENNCCLLFLKTTVRILKDIKYGNYIQLYQWCDL